MHLFIRLYILFALGAVGLDIQPLRAEFANHQAFYTVNVMVKEGFGSGEIAGGIGHLSYSLTGGKACHGYSTISETAIRYYSHDNYDDYVVQETVKQTMWESIKGDVFYFSYNTHVNDSLVEEVKGHAKKIGSQKTHILSDKPTVKDITFSKGFSFPMSHLYKLIKGAQENKKMVVDNYYDASENIDQYYRVTTIIEEKNGYQGEKKIIENGKDNNRNLTHWKMHSSFFIPSNSQYTPYYDIIYDVASDGVIWKITFRNKQFELVADVHKLRYDDEGMCNNF